MLSSDLKQCPKIAHCEECDEKREKDTGIKIKCSK